MACIGKFFPNTIGSIFVSTIIFLPTVPTPLRLGILKSSSCCWAFDTFNFGGDSWGRDVGECVLDEPFEKILTKF